jgi:hypothetical protein
VRLFQSLSMPWFRHFVLLPRNTFATRPNLFTGETRMLWFLTTPAFGAMIPADTLGIWTSGLAAQLECHLRVSRQKIILRHRCSLG